MLEQRAKRVRLVVKTPVRKNVWWPDGEFSDIRRPWFVQTFEFQADAVKNDYTYAPLICDSCEMPGSLQYALLPATDTHEGAYAATAYVRMSTYLCPACSTRLCFEGSVACPLTLCNVRLACVV